LETKRSHSGEPGDLVAEPLGGDDSYFLGNLLVGLKVEGESGVVLLHQDARCSLHGFSPDTTLTSLSDSCICKRSM